jgi:hypothetical protein
MLANYLRVYDGLNPAIFLSICYTARKNFKKRENFFINSNQELNARFYPYASKLGDDKNVCQPENLTGLLPLMPAYAECTSGSECEVNLAKTKVEFSLPIPNFFTSNKGSCIKLKNTCTCSGPGICQSSLTKYKFECKSNGVCESKSYDTGAAVNGTYVFIYDTAIPDRSVVAGAFERKDENISYNGFGVGKFYSENFVCDKQNHGLNDLPKWFIDNRWQDFIYYALDPECSSAKKNCSKSTIKVGYKNKISAVLVSSGAKLKGQQRPSNDLSNYLENPSNLNDFGQSVFNPLAMPKSNSFNDLSVVVRH